jgi:hypothetical protein
MKAELPESIVEMIRRQFSQKEQPIAISLLSEYKLEDDEYRERVLRCIVSLAGKDIERLKHFIECAREDHRNLIYWHEHGEQSLKIFSDKCDKISPSK